MAALFVLLAHGTHPGSHPAGSGGPPDVVFLVAGGVLLAALAVYAAVAERRFGRDFRSTRKAARRADLQRLHSRRRWAAGAATLLVAGTTAFAVAKYERVEGPKLVPAPSPSPGDPFALEFLEAFSDGYFLVTASNASADNAELQCSVKPLAEDGSVPLDRTYDSVTEDGSVEQADAYTVRYQLAAGGSVSFSANLQVTGEVAEYTGDCESL